MDTTLDDGHEELGRIARQLFEARCPLTTVRQLEQDDVGYLPALWAEMAGLDWLSLTYPEALGGSGGTLVDLSVIYQELGRSLVPSPHLASAVIAGEALVGEQSGHHHDLLASMVAGQAIVVPALTEPDAGFGPDAVTMPSRATPAGYEIDGTKILVPYAHVATRLLVAARTQAAPDGITLFLIDPAAEGVAITPMPNIADAPLFAVTFDTVLVPTEDVVGEVGQGWSLLGPALDRATVLRCAEIVGAGKRLLELSVEYALHRKQFGRPIGQFQAVQFLCTDIAIDTHTTELLCHQAAWRLDNGLPARREVSMAKAQASRSIQRIVHCAHEVHAGVAFMVETDVQLYTRRAKHWEFDLGDARYHDDVIAAGLEV
jgi:alkylation response protein AidB-like acyl-CoA dehydrogenase